MTLQSLCARRCGRRNASTAHSYYEQASIGSPGLSCDGALIGFAATFAKALIEMQGLAAAKKATDDAAADKAERDLSELVGRRPVKSDDGRLSFFDLRGYNERLRSRLSPQELARLRMQALSGE